MNYFASFLDHHVITYMHSMRARREVRFPAVMMNALTNGCVVGMMETSRCENNLIFLQLYSKKQDW